MCLAVPGEVVSIDEEDALLRSARVDFGGVMRTVSLTLLPEARPGQYVLVHAGVAISIVDEAEAARVFEYLEEMGELDELREADG